MRTIFSIKNIIVTVITLCSFNYCSGQANYTSEFTVSTIPDIPKFEKMTSDELRFDSIKEKHNRERLQQISDGTAFIEGISEKDKQEAIEYQKIITQQYSDNRSRYFLNLKVNNVKNNDHFKIGDTLTTDCNCYLSGDTIRIKMGTWIYGGFVFFIDINKNKFQSTYLEDTRKQYIYKKNLADKNLADNVEIEAEEQSLILDSNPNYAIGENIMGYLTFKTKDYYRTSEYDAYIAKDNYSADKMDKLNMTGSLYFKCKLRKKIISDD